MNIKIAWLIVVCGLCLAPFSFAGKKLQMPSFLRDTYLQLNKTVQTKFGSNVACEVKKILDRYVAKQPIKK